MDLRQSKAYADYLKSQGWVIEKVKHSQIFIRKIPLTPISIIKVQRPENIPFSDIANLAKKHRAIKIYLEPLTKTQATPAKKRGYHLIREPYLPTKTLLLDLTQSEKQILSRMKKDTRYSLRQTPPTIHHTTDLANFHRAWKKTTGLKRWAPSLKSLKNLKKAFGKDALFLAAAPSADEPIIAGTIILTTPTSSRGIGTALGARAYYYQAFTSPTGRQQLAQYHLVWQAIKISKKRGCRVFDFEGIFDPRFPNKSWYGFSHFKRSFGGKEKKYPGCFSKTNLLRVGN